MINFLKIKSSYFTVLKPWGNRKDLWLGLFLSSLCINVITLVFPLTLLQVYDRIIPNQALMTLVALVAAVMTALVLEATLKVCRSLIGAWADARYEHAVGYKAFEHVINAKITSFEQEGSGKHFERLNAVHTLKDFYGGQALVSLFDLPFTVIFLALIGYLAGWVMFIPLIVMGVSALKGFYILRRLRHNLKGRRQGDDQRMNFVIQTLSNIHTVKANSMEAQMLRRYERLQKSAMQHDFDLSEQSNAIANLANNASQITTILVVVFGCIEVMVHNMTLGALAACILLVGRLMAPVTRVISIWARLQSIRLAEESIDELRTLELEPITLPDFPPIQGEIQLKGISFGHVGRPPLFDHIDLTVHAKEAIAITSDSLTGKSTFLGLIQGVVAPTHGKILIDGKDISLYNPQSLRAQLGYLPQKGVLFEGTLLENLTLFQNTFVRVEKAKQLAETLGLDEILRRLPKGYDTPVGHRAVDVMPKGIIQRMAIVRAFVNDPKIVLFDEANTNLDKNSSELLANFLTAYKKENTVILVTRHPRFLAVADRAYTFEKGHLIPYTPEGVA